MVFTTLASPLSKSKQNNKSRNKGRAPGSVFTHLEVVILQNLDEGGLQAGDRQFAEFLALQGVEVGGGANR